MSKAEEFLRAHARILQRATQAQDVTSIDRVRGLRELAELDAAALAERIQRKHCLTVVALELGARGYRELLSELNAVVGEDFGTWLHVTGHTNIWSAHYDEAVKIRNEHGGYLLPYKKQFMIVENHYVETLGLDPQDPDWERIGRDWPAPKDREARDRLTTQLLRTRLG